jgi:D-3-phosphoglycerate dehydrogenase / 2-oxoglutarate reductase
MVSYKVLLTDGLEENGQSLMRQSIQVDDKSGINAEDLLNIVGNYDALIVRGRTKVTAAVFNAGKRLKVVGRAGVGVDNIDLAAAKAAGVTVVNSPMATTVAVAELAMSMMLALVREIPRADHSMKEGKWLKKEFEGTELNGKVLGIIGMGRIGAAVGARAAAFGMSLLGYDPLIDGKEIKSRGAEPVSLDELYKQADVITLHIPLTPESKNLINSGSFTQMKKGVYLVCAARGGVIDEDALLEALNSGQVAGAALDVFTAEPPGLTDLVSHPKVIATPHIGAQTIEAQSRAAYDISTEILRALNGQSLRWKVA